MIPRMRKLSAFARGADCIPEHRHLGHVGPVSLRRDGIATVMSGPGLGGRARVVVRTGEQTPPYVELVKASASLPVR